MRKKETKLSKVDPELARQMQSAGDDDIVEATFSLGPEDAKRPATPEQVRSGVQGVLKRVSKAVGSEPQHQNVFANIRSFVVAAKPQYLQRLIDQPEVSIARPNRRPESMRIDPVDSRPVTLDAVKNDTVKKGPSKRPAARRP